MTAHTTGEARLTKILEAAQQLQAQLHDARLHIVEAQPRFDARTSTDNEGHKLPLTFADSGSLIDPVSVSSDVKAQLVGVHSPRSSNRRLTIH